MINEDYFSTKMGETGEIFFQGPLFCIFPTFNNVKNIKLKLIAIIRKGKDKNFHPDKSQERIDWKFIFISRSHSSPVKVEIFEVFLIFGGKKSMMNEKYAVISEELKPSKKP